jgi:hypothetical protein
MKRFYHLLALLAMINLFAVVGLISYLFMSGKLNPQRVEQIATVLRGEFPTSQPAIASTQPANREEKARGSGAEIAQREEKKELLDLVRKRREKDLVDRDALNKTISLDTRQVLERLDKEKKALQDQKKALSSEGERAGFEKQLTMLSSAAPKLSLNILKTQMKEPDAVQVLMKMDENRVKGIINACKTEDDKAWIGRILNQIGKYGNPMATGVDGSGASPTNGG